MNIYVILKTLCLAYKEGMEQMKNDFDKLMNSKKNDVYI